MKNWIKERAVTVYSEKLEVKYVGGDPRIVFINTYEEQCFNADGELISTLHAEVVSKEAPIKSLVVEGIENLLAAHGIHPR